VFLGLAAYKSSNASKSIEFLRIIWSRYRVFELFLFCGIFIGFFEFSCYIGLAAKLPILRTFV
jgi:hypothetical protein